MKIITRAIPTNIITGFLGVGKTTAIMHLLQSKPGAERWAVLVNEFGEVGIDAALIRGSQSAGEKAEQGVFIRELPGGCMCCSAGVPMQVALNQLLRQAKPDRLLIEPTGLGHPQEVIAALSAPHYREVIDLRATITLVDARQLQDPRYRCHDSFIQQLQVADLIVANKQDLYQGHEMADLQRYLAELSLEVSTLRSVSDGQLVVEWLSAPATIAAAAAKSSRLAVPLATSPTSSSRDENSDSVKLSAEAPKELLRVEQSEAQGVVTASWMIPAEVLLDYLPLYAVLANAPFQRLKGVCHTTEGVYAFNAINGVLSCSPMKQSADSRVVVIGGDSQDLLILEQKIRLCIVS